CQQHGASPLTF
nr:immunoglobulin light chain junction region [Macaca mulatta]MOX52682.1 immunoglobulin light chain junction region [Macaca mulatta]MOX52839.1 immunoglobulin light chain junction region [Macaca mulatta]MOX52889.1 immunoglobulin light chain junction region [Macaca mulatta]MOX52914.1 immunoglobulin light chain junction region [Macaca mulatta]